MAINRLLVFQRVLIVPHSWQICSYIHMKLIVYNIYKRVSSGIKKTSFNLTFRYIDDVPSLNNKFNDYIDVIIIRRNWILKTLQMIQNGLIILTFILNLMRMVSNKIPESPAYMYGVFDSQLMRYARVCSRYEDFLFDFLLTPLWIMLNGLFTNYDTRLVFCSSVGIYFLTNA